MATHDEIRDFIENTINEALSDIQDDVFREFGVQFFKGADQPPTSEMERLAVHVRAATAQFRAEVTVSFLIPK